MVRKTLGEFGHLGVLANNVLLPVPMQPFEQISFDTWKRKINSDITGSFLLCREVIPAMIQQKWGRIINYAGLAGFRGTNVLDSTTELGMVGLTRSIAREYGKYNITANCIGPGGIISEEDARQNSFAPQDSDALPRWGKPEEVSFLVVCLASEDAGYITGQCLLPNGGKYFL